MRRLIFVLLLGFLLLQHGAARAQAVVAFETVQVKILPEYDRPDLLVIYDFKLTTESPLPASLSIHIPRTAGKPNAVAMKEPDGRLIDADYTTRISGDWIQVNLTTPSPEIRLEYYDPSITRQASQRSFQYAWPGDYAIRSFTIQVEQPTTATNLVARLKQTSAGGVVSESDMGTGRPGEDGLIGYTTVLSDFPAGSSLSVSVQYQKSDDTLSRNYSPVLPSEPITTSTTGRTTLGGLVPWILGALGLLVITGGAFWYWQSGRDTRQVDRKRHAPEKRKKAVQEPGSATYCPQCGKRATPSDLYCRTCGAKLRID